MTIDKQQLKDNDFYTVQPSRCRGYQVSPTSELDLDRALSGKDDFWIGHRYLDPQDNDTPLPVVIADGLFSLLRIDEQLQIIDKLACLERYDIPVYIWTDKLVKCSRQIDLHHLMLASKVESHSSILQRSLATFDQCNIFYHSDLLTFPKKNAQDGSVDIKRLFINSKMRLVALVQYILINNITTLKNVDQSLLDGLIEFDLLVKLMPVDTWHFCSEIDYQSIEVLLAANPNLKNLSFGGKHLEIESFADDFVASGQNNYGSITQLHFATKMPIEVVTQWLTLCPNLETLRLDDIRGCLDSQFVQQHIRHFRKLSTLNIKLFNVNASAEELLQNWLMLCPNLVELEVDSSIAADDESRVKFTKHYNSLQKFTCRIRRPKFLARLLPMLPNLKALKVWFDDSSFEIFEQTITEQQVRFEQLTTLQVTLPLDYKMPFWLKACPNLKVLTIYGNEEDIYFPSQFVESNPGGFPKLVDFFESSSVSNVESTLFWDVEEFVQSMVLFPNLNNLRYLGERDGYIDRAEKLLHLLPDFNNNSRQEVKLDINSLSSFTSGSAGRLILQCLGAKKMQFDVYDSDNDDNKVTEIIGDQLIKVLEQHPFQMTELSMGQCNGAFMATMLKYSPNLVELSIKFHKNEGVIGLSVGHSNVKKLKLHYFNWADISIVLKKFPNCEQLVLNWENKCAETVESNKLTPFANIQTLKIEKKIPLALLEQIVKLFPSAKISKLAGFSDNETHEELVTLKQKYAPILPISDNLSVNSDEKTLQVQAALFSPRAIRASENFIVGIPDGPDNYFLDSVTRFSGYGCMDFWLEKCPNLQIVNVSNFSLTDSFCQENLGLFAQIKSFIVSDVKSNQSPDQILALCPKLNTLGVKGYRNKQDTFFYGSSACDEISNLGININFFDDGELESFLGAFPSLERLKIYIGKKQKAPIIAVDMDEYTCEDLRALEIENDGSDISFKLISDLLMLFPNIEKIVLSGGGNYGGIFSKRFLQFTRPFFCTSISVHIKLSNDQKDQINALFPRAGLVHSASSTVSKRRNYTKEIDLNTEQKEGDASHDVIQYFTGDDDLGFSCYRLAIDASYKSPVNEINVERNSALFNDFVPNQGQLYAVVPKTLTHKWISIPSYFTNETIDAYQCEVPLKFAFQESTGLHFVSAQNSQDVGKFVQIAYVVRESSRLEIDNSDLNTELLAGLQLDSDLNVVANQSSAFLHSHSDMLKVQLLQTFFAGFGSGKLAVSAHAKQNVRINAIIHSQVGACRHRAFALYHVLKAFMLPVRIVSNDCHAFIEVRIGLDWYRMRVGGYPATLVPSGELVPLGDDVEPMELDDYFDQYKTKSSFMFKSMVSSEISADQLDIIDIISAPMIISECSLGDFTTKLPAQLTKMDQCYPWLKKESDRLAENAANLLIVCQSSVQLNALVKSMLQGARDDLRQTHYVHRLSDIQYKTLAINDSGYYTAPSALVQFLSSAQRQDLFMLNWSEFEAENIGHNSLLDDHRTIGGFYVPEGVVVMGVITQDALAQYGPDFFSRFSFKTILSDDLALASNQLEAQKSEHPERVVAINLMHSSDWQSKLLGAYHFNAESIQYLHGELTLALQNCPGNINIINPPSDPDFDQFLSQLKINGRYFCNGQTVNLPNKMDITVSTIPYDFSSFDLCIESLSKQNQSDWHEVLNATTLSKFTKLYHSVNGQLQTLEGLMAHYANAHLNLLVTDDLTEGEWYAFCLLAQQSQVSIKVLVAKPNSLPAGLSLKRNNEIETVAKQQSAHALIITDDQDACLAQMIEDKKIDVTICVDQNTMASQLLGYLNFSQSQFGQLTFPHSQGALVKQLLLRRNVAIKGDFSSELGFSLATLFSINPYLLVNGKKYYTESSVAIITENNRLMPYLLSRHQHRYTQQNQLRYSHQLLFERNAGQFTGDQLTQMMRSLHQKPDYYDQSEAMAQSCEQYDQLRINKVLNVLVKQPCVFMVGETGAGKSTLVISQLFNMNNIRGFVGVDKMAAWLNCNVPGLKILFVDEANLLPEYVLTQLEGLFHSTPTILINNQLFFPSSEHKVIFAGNPLSYQGRVDHSLWQRHVLAQWFNRLPTRYLKERVLEKYCDKLCIQKSLVPMLVERIAVVYDELIALMVITPRDMEQILLSYACLYIDYHGEHNDKVIITNVIKSEVARISCGHPNQQDIMEKLDTLFEDEWDFELYPVDDKNECALLEKHGYVLTQSVEKNVMALIKYLAMRQLKNGLYGRYTLGNSGLIFEGESGVGKSALVVAYLLAHGFNKADYDLVNDSNQYFYHLSGADLSRIIPLLHKAFHEGAIVLIDEVNTFPAHIERMLNTLLSGTDMSGQLADKKGFMLIGTQNPADTYRGRVEASKAFNNRCEISYFSGFSQWDLMRVIGKSQRIPKRLAQRYVLDYLSLVQKAKLSGNIYIPTPRDLIRALAQGNVNDAVKKVTILYILIENVINHGLNTNRLVSIKKLLEQQVDLAKPVDGQSCYALLIENLELRDIQQLVVLILEQYQGPQSKRRKLERFDGENSTVDVPQNTLQANNLVSVGLFSEPYAATIEFEQFVQSVIAKCRHFVDIFPELECLILKYSSGQWVQNSDHAHL